MLIPATYIRRVTTCPKGRASHGNDHGLGLRTWDVQRALDCVGRRFPNVDTTSVGIRRQLRGWNNVVPHRVS